MSDKYSQVGYGGIAVEAGKRPAILVVDLQTAFTDPRYALGGLPLVHAATDRTAALLKVGYQYPVGERQLA